MSIGTPSEFAIEPLVGGSSVVGMVGIFEMDRPTTDESRFCEGLHQANPPTPAPCVGR